MLDEVGGVLGVNTFSDSGAFMSQQSGYLWHGYILLSKLSRHGVTQDMGSNVGSQPGSFDHTVPATFKRSDSTARPVDNM